MIDLKSWPNAESFKAAVNKTPFYRTIAMELVKLDKKGAVVRIKSGRRHKNVWGTVHGGAVASLVDSTSGLSAVPHLKEGETLVTVSLQVDYFAPVAKGDVTARGRLVYRGKRLAKAEAVIEDDKRKLIAKGHAMYMILSAMNGFHANARRRI